VSLRVVLIKALIFSICLFIASKYFGSLFVLSTITAAVLKETLFGFDQIHACVCEIPVRDFFMIVKENDKKELLNNERIMISLNCFNSISLIFIYLYSVCIPSRKVGIIFPKNNSYF
jgi:hypothetical protein